MRRPVGKNPYREILNMKEELQMYAQLHAEREARGAGTGIYISFAGSDRIRIDIGGVRYFALEGKDDLAVMLPVLKNAIAATGELEEKAELQDALNVLKSFVAKEQKYAYTSPSYRTDSKEVCDLFLDTVNGRMKYLEKKIGEYESRLGKESKEVKEIETEEPKEEIVLDGSSWMIRLSRIFSELFDIKWTKLK